MVSCGQSQQFIGVTQMIRFAITLEAKRETDSDLF
jgi:hypothetical protein